MDQFDTLEATIRARLSAGSSPDTSYVARLAAKGRSKIAQKVGEEAIECVIAGVADDRDGLVGEAADLMFHLTLLLAHAGVTLDEVRAELARREGVSGIAEKAARDS